MKLHIFLYIFIYVHVYICIHIHVYVYLCAYIDIEIYSMKLKHQVDFARKGFISRNAGQPPANAHRTSILTYIALAMSSSAPWATKEPVTGVVSGRYRASPQSSRDGQLPNGRKKIASRAGSKRVQAKQAVLPGSRA